MLPVLRLASPPARPARGRGTGSWDRALHWPWQHTATVTVTSAQAGIESVALASWQLGDFEESEPTQARRGQFLGSRLCFGGFRSSPAAASQALKRTSGLEA